MEGGKNVVGKGAKVTGTTATSRGLGNEGSPGMMGEDWQAVEFSWSLSFKSHLAQTHPGFYQVKGQRSFPPGVFF